eukprot:403335778
MGQILCCMQQEFDPTLNSKMSNSQRLARVSKNFPRVTQITIEQIAQDLLGDSINYANLYKPNEPLSFQVSFNTFVFQKLTMSLYTQYDETRPISKIMIDYFSLALCPQHCEFELKNIKNDKSIGRVQFELEFQQQEEIQIVLKDLLCKIEGKNQQPFYAVFKALTNQECAVSKETSTLFGDFDKQINKSVYHWGIAQDLYEDPTVKIQASLNTLKQSTLQVCIYKNKEFQRKEQVKSMKKNSQINLLQCSDDSFDDLDHEEPRSVRNKEPKNQLAKYKTQRESKFKSPIKTSQRRASKLIQPSQQPNALKKNKTQQKIEEFQISSLVNNIDPLLQSQSHQPRNFIEEQESDDEELMNNDLKGECYICFQKLLKTELRLFDRRDSFAIRNKSNFQPSQQSRQQVKKFSEKISVAGKINGKIKGSFKILNLPQLQQMSIGILSEKGIQMTIAPILTDNETSLFFFKKSKSNQKIKDLQTMLKKLKDLDQLKGRKLVKSNQEKEGLLGDIVHLLKHSDQLNRQMFYYESYLDLIGAQQTMIELGFHCLLYAGNVKYEFRHYYYTLLTLLFDRQELKLSSVGFLGGQDGQGALNLDPQILQNTLEDAITKFSRKGVELYLRNYIEKFISIALFRIPKFRHSFVECILRKSNNTIEEWKNISWNLDGKADKENDYDASLASFFDWESYFYNQIPNCQEKKESEQILLRVLNSERWQAKIQKRTQAFFQIICKVVDQMHHKVKEHNQGKQSMFWQDIPGYPQVLKAFLQELKTVPILDYPDALIEASYIFLTNSQLLTIFSTIVFKKTNVYDSAAMTRSFDLITKWILMINKKGESFPSNFDFSFYFQAVNIALEKVDHNLSTTKVLWSLYKTLSIFPLEQRLILTHEFIRKYFYRFFFHWSYNIREVFFMLLLYEIDFNLISGQTKKVSNYSEQMKGFKMRNMGEGENQGFDRKSYKKQQTIDLEKCLEEVNNSTMLKSNASNSTFFNTSANMTQNSSSRKISFQNKNAKSLQEEEDNFFQNEQKQPIFNKALSSSKRSFVNNKDTERKQNIQKLVLVHKLLESKYQEIEFLKQHLKQLGLKNVSPVKGGVQDSEEEYDFDQNDDQEQLHLNNQSLSDTRKSNVSQSQQKQQDQIEFNRIINKVPDDLRVYVQDKVFNQFDKMYQEFDEWQKKHYTQIGLDWQLNANIQLPDINVDNQIPLDDVYNEGKVIEY